MKTFNFNRRDFLGLTAAGLGAGALGLTPSGDAQAAHDR